MTARIIQLTGTTARLEKLGAFPLVAIDAAEALPLIETLRAIEAKKKLKPAR